MKTRQILFLILAGLMFAASPVSASLVGALDDITEAMDGGTTSSNNQPTSTSQPAPAPAEPQKQAEPPKQDEFYPGKTLSQMVDPETGNTKSLIEMPDGSMKMVEKDADGNLISETEIPEEDRDKFRPSTPGGKVEMETLPDGSMELRDYDQDGNLLSSTPFSDEAQREAPAPPVQPPADQKPRELPSASMFDPKTGITTSSAKNADGSRTVTKTDKDGNILSEERMPAPGSGGAYASSYDPKTGETVTSRQASDGSHTISKSKSWKDDKGVEHTQIKDNRGNQTEIIKQKDGSTVTTQWDKKDNKTEMTQHPDGSKKVVSSTKDGFVEEKVTRADGQTQVVKKDHAGNILETTETTSDGRKITTDDKGVKSVVTSEIDGTYTVESTDKKGNQVVTEYDSRGNVLNQSENLAVPKEVGERYFENELGGRPGEWETLPQSVKNRYANSENQIKNNVENELLREHQEQEKLKSDEDMARWNAEQNKITEENLAKIAKEDEEAKARYAEFLKKEEQMAARNDAKNKLQDYDRRIYEARARGDKAEAERLMIESDEFSERSNDLFEMTPTEEKEVQRKQETRDRITQRVTSQARSVADSNLIAIEGEQELKETVTGKAKYVSIGAEMQEQTKATTRAADRELAFAKAKQAEIARMLSDPKTTREEREVLHGMLDMADLQESGAAEMLQSNAMLTAAGYGIDAAMVVSGGLATKGVQLAAGKFLAKETAEAVVKVATKDSVVTLAGQGATKAATGVTSRVAGDAAAQTVERALTADVGAAAGSKISEVATRAIGEKGVAAVTNVATKVGEVATIDVGEAASKIIGRETGEAAATAASTVSRESIMATADPRGMAAAGERGMAAAGERGLEAAGGHVGTRVAAPNARGTVHAVDRAGQRGVQPHQQLDAYANPIKTGPVTYDQFGRAAQKIEGAQAGIVVNPETGNVVTTWAQKEATAARLQRQAARTGNVAQPAKIPRSATSPVSTPGRGMPVADEVGMATAQGERGMAAVGERGMTAAGERGMAAVGERGMTAAGRTTRMMPRAAADDAATATTRMGDDFTKTQALPRQAVPSQAAATGADDALRAQNMAREAALNERLTREAAEAQKTLQQRGVDSLSADEAAKLHTQIQTGAMNRQMQGLVQEARKAGIPESRIKELTDMAHNPALPKRGASMANQNLVEEIAQSRGQTILESEAAEPLLTTVVNVQTGAAGRQEVEVLRRGIESSKQRGTDFFDDLSRQGTSSSDGYHSIADPEDIEALRRFAQQNRLIE